MSNSYISTFVIVIDLKSKELDNTKKVWDMYSTGELRSGSCNQFMYYFSSLLEELELKRLTTGNLVVMGTTKTPSHGFPGDISAKLREAATKSLEEIDQGAFVSMGSMRNSKGDIELHFSISYCPRSHFPELDILEDRDLAEYLAQRNFTDPTKS